ncbi:MAG TPA: hypothetical protein VF628_02365 [Allosphingosinicella sp.]|jgi:hypothetical protein
MDGIGGKAVFWSWQIGSVATFVYLTFFDNYPYTWWNWLIAVPVNMILGEIWPIYWLILRPLFA